MATPEYPYPEDEFDSLGRGRAPEGAHRTPVPRWRRVLPFVVVLILAPALAYLGVSYLASRGAEQASPGLSAGPTGEPGAAGEAVAGGPLAGEQEAADPAAEATGGEPPADEGAPAPVAEEPAGEEPADDAATPGPVARDAGIVALNGTSKPGLAGHAAARLERDGFTAVSAGNARSSVPTASTVFYNNPGLAASAARAAEVLGIANVVELASATPSIAVVLRADYEY